LRRVLMQLLFLLSQRSIGEFIYHILIHCEVAKDLGALSLIWLVLIGLCLESERFVGELGRSDRAWQYYGSMEVGSIVFNVMPLERAE
jgi:hypothetical protein